MIKAKTKMIERDSEASASEVFAVGDNIVPIKVASVDEILKLEDVKDLVVVPEREVERLIVQNKPTNPMSKFFVKMSGYLDSMESFLDEIHLNAATSIEQQKSIFHIEDSDQKQRTNRTKRAVKKISDERAAARLARINLGDGGDILGLLAIHSLGSRGGGSDSISGERATKFDGKVFKETVRQGDFAVGTGSNVDVSPRWIPFPKGTTGLTFTSGFGQRSSPGGVGSTNHKGIDIAGKIGTPIITPISGVVDVMGPLGTYGNVVFVKSGSLVMEFGHLNGINVNSIGEELKAGQVIGTLGTTGASTGPHLHWTIRVNGRPVDPVQWTQVNDPLASTAGFKREGEEEPLDKESEGGINYHRIMVGEAGTEFVIPMSQMPIFAQLMMEEKIKSMNPNYTTPYGRFDDIGFERQSGFSNMMFSDGAILAAEEKIKKYEALGAYTPETGRGGSLPDYITVDGQESIRSGTPRSVAFNPNTRLYSYIDSEGYPTIGWGSTFYGDIFSGGKGTAVRDGDKTTVGEATKLFKSHVRQLYDGYNETYPLWKHFTDKQVAGLLSYYYNRGVNVGLTLDIHKRALRSGDMKTLADDIERDIVNVGPARRKAEADLIRSGPSKIVGPGIVGSEVGPKEVGTGIPFFPDLTIINAIKGLFQGNRSKTKKTRTISPEEERNQRLRNSMGASEFFGTREYGLDQIPGRVDLQSSNRLNSIPGNEQMQIANETQEQFSFDNAKGQIIALYKPTVYYTES